MKLLLSLLICLLPLAAQPPVVMYTGQPGSIPVKIISGGTGTVTEITTTTPITGGPITETGAIACPTCTTNASALTSGRIPVASGAQTLVDYAALAFTGTVLNIDAAQRFTNNKTLLFRHASLDANPGQIYANTSNQFIINTESLQYPIYIDGSVLNIGDNAGTGAINFGTSGARAIFATTGAVFNEASGNLDFRVESDNNANMLVVDASADGVGIGNAAPAYPLDVTGLLRSSAGAILTEAAAPSGVAGAAVLYSKTDHLLYTKLNNGSEDQICTLVSGCGAGGTGDEATSVTIPDGATPTLTATSNTVQTFTKTATASVTSCTLASLTIGQLVILQWTQDGTGGWDFACAGFVGLGEVDTTMDVACVQTFRATSSSAAIAVGGMVCDGDPLNLIPGSGGTTATFPAGTITVTQTIASGTKSLATAEIASEACTSAQTDTATGAATTDAIVWSFDADVTGVTGYAPLSAGGLILYVYPTSDTFNVKVCNPTADPITPGAVDLNWRILR